MLGEKICKCEGDTEIAIFQTGEASLSYFVFPSMGDRPMMTEARADLTCWLASETSSLTQGRMWFMMTVSWRLRSRFWQKSLTLWAAAARTSASQSFNRFCWGRDKKINNQNKGQLIGEFVTPLVSYKAPGRLAQGLSLWFLSQLLFVGLWICRLP